MVEDDFKFLLDLVDKDKKRYDRLLVAFSELQTAAQKVVDEANHIHDTEPYPLKYRAPYGALAELMTLLGKQRGLK
jgi:hypothetical protein